MRTEEFLLRRQKWNQCLNFHGGINSTTKTPIISFLAFFLVVSRLKTFIKMKNFKKVVSATGGRGGESSFNTVNKYKIYKKNKTTTEFIFFLNAFVIRFHYDN